MNLILKFLLLVAVFHLSNEVMNSQVLIRIEKPFISKKLSGIVKDPSGSTMPGVEICKFDKDWKNSLDCTETNEDGKFNFPKIDNRLNYLRFSASGFNQLEVIVKLVKKSHSKLEFTLDLAL